MNEAWASSALTFWPWNSSRGFTSFSDDGALLVSPALPRDRLAVLGVRGDARLTAVAGEHPPFLTFQRDRVFIRPDDVD